jgi:murein DD-endopeptidase MepM/ murein hydrolase activator NlpD
MYPKPKKGLDGFTVAALAVIVFIGLSLVVDSGEGSSGQNNNGSPPPQQSGTNTGGQAQSTPIPIPTPLTLPLSGDQTILAAPYDEYLLTQGPHGFSYGHSAIDISGGKGVIIKSPINGIVSENYVDQYGNTTLILDNNRYTVTFLHGNFSANVGDKLTIGQTLGTEGNNGYTMDMSGRLCTNRDCGYHSHLNVFDKELGVNINPLDYFEIQPATELRRFSQ